MGYIIAVAGKGGTGKTTIASLLVRLIKEKRLGSILAVDADPNSNLAEALGVEVKETIGSILDDISNSFTAIPSGMSKDRFIEYKVQTAISEAEGFDLLTMGRPEGPGCYCYVNNVLRNIMEKLIKDYDYIVIDNEAGLEHLSRRTTRQADILLVISDPTLVGLKSAQRISDLAKELKIKIKNKFLLINFTKIEKLPKIKAMDLEYLGSIPEDKQIRNLSLNGASLWKLNDKAKSLVSLRKLIERIW